MQEKYCNADGSINTKAMDLVVYSHGMYQSTDEMLGFFGYSVASEEVLQRRMKRG